jgi:hypothetical protein
MKYNTGLTFIIVTKGVIGRRISKTNRQYNDQKKKNKKSNDDLLRTHIKLKIE